MDEQPKKQDHEDDLEIKASLNEFSFSAGGSWKQYLGPWIGPIVLVAIIGFAAALVIVAVYSTKAVLPCITFPTRSFGIFSFWSAGLRLLQL